MRRIQGGSRSSGKIWPPRTVSIAMERITNPWISRNQKVSSPKQYAMLNCTIAESSRAGMPIAKRQPSTGKVRYGPMTGSAMSSGMKMSAPDTIRAETNMVNR